MYKKNQPLVLVTLKESCLIRVRIAARLRNLYGVTKPRHDASGRDRVAVVWVVIGPVFDSVDTAAFELGSMLRSQVYCVLDAFCGKVGRLS
jgi:hypothetical protein